MERSKNRLELRKEAAGMHPPFSVSISCGHPFLDVTKVSDKMQTKTAQKETRNAVARIIPGLPNLYTMEVFPHPLQR
jgi:hypothetical protein